MIDKLDKQFSKVQERVEKFGVEKCDGDNKFVGYAEKMNDFRSACMTATALFHARHW